MRILFLNPDRGHTCSFYRSGGIAKGLRNMLGANYTIDVMCWADVSTDWQTIGNNDIIMLQRPYHAAAVDFCKHIKQMGTKLWLDYDDNLFCVSPENRAWPIFDDPATKTNVKNMIGLADVVSVTNEDLRQSYLPMNKNIVVIPNAFNDTIFNINRTIEERDNTVVWRGSDTHIYDIMNMAPAITMCAREFPEYEFTYIGYNPWFLEQTKNVCFLRAMDVVDYFDNTFRLKPAVVHVPLHDNLFNRCKSNIAFIEGSYWGAVCVVPEWWGHLPGTVTYKDNQTYYDALSSVLKGKVDIKAMNKLAWDWVKKHLLLSDINKLRVDIIHKLLKN
jgi:hypothetical protein